jgi:hypothetical protein
MSIRAAFEAWEGTDSEFLADINNPRNKRIVNGGLVSLAMVAAVSEQLAGLLAVTMKRVIANLAGLIASLPDGEQKDQAEGQYEIFDSFFKRLKESSYGAPIDSDSFRTQFTGVATQAGWDASTIEAFLSLGAVMESDAQQLIGREATQQDVDDVRSQIAVDELAARKQALEDAAMDRLQAYREALSSWDGSGEGPVL